MAIALHTGRIPISSGTGTRANDHTYPVDRLPRGCWVAMAGYHVQYDNSDHHIKTLELQLTCGMGTDEIGPKVFVTGQVLLADDNGDDPFSGWIDYVLFVDSGPRPPIDPGILNAGVDRPRSIP